MILKGLRHLFFYLLFFLGLAHTALFSTETQDTSERIAFINTALVYLGTPYRYGGHSPKGMDCSGFVCRSVSDCSDIRLPRSSASIVEYTKRITDEEIQPGDLLFFKTTGRISHIGIYLGAGTFIHSASDGPQTGVIISSIQEAYWKKTYRFAGSILRPEELFIRESTVPFFLRTAKNCPLHPAIEKELSKAVQSLSAKTKKK